MHEMSHPSQLGLLTVLVGMAVLLIRALSVADLAHRLRHPLLHSRPYLQRLSARQQMHPTTRDGNRALRAWHQAIRCPTLRYDPLVETLFDTALSSPELTREQWYNLLTSLDGEDCHHRMSVAFTYSNRAQILQHPSLTDADLIAALTSTQCSLWTGPSASAGKQTTVERGLWALTFSDLMGGAAQLTPHNSAELTAHCCTAASFSPTARLVLASLAPQWTGNVDLLLSTAQSVADESSSRHVTAGRN